MTSTKSTLETIRSLLSAMEPAEPQTAIVAYLAAHEGKKLTERDAKKMRETIDPSIRFTSTGVKMLSMPKIEWGNYGRRESADTKGGCLYLHGTDGNTETGMAYACASETVKGNPAYFSAREERNAQREKALAGPALMKAASVYVDAINAAHASLKALCEYGKTMSVIQYDIDNLVSCKNGRGR